MARPRSEDKRNAILDAAITVFAKRGADSTPTSAISGAARVAEGTLFTYFENKDTLVNEVYRLLKRELADYLMASYPKAVDARVRFRHMWDRYVHWGVTHPDKFRVLAQLQVSDTITAESKALGYTAFAEIERLARDSVRKKRIRNQPLPFLAAVMGALAETTIEFASQNRNSRFDYVAAGFDVFWAGVVQA